MNVWLMFLITVLLVLNVWYFVHMLINSIEVLYVD